MLFGMYSVTTRTQLLLVVLVRCLPVDEPQLLFFLPAHELSANCFCEAMYFDYDVLLHLDNG